MSSLRSRNFFDCPPEIIDLILDACAFDTLAKLALLCMQTRTLVIHHARSDLHHRLRPFFPNIQQFFAILKENGGVLYGSFVVAYILRARHWSCYSLGIMLPNGNAARAVIESYLTGVGYVTEDTPRSVLELFGTTASGAAQRRYHFVSLYTGHHIHVFVGKSFSPLVTIARSWSSLDFAYITGDLVFCAYPQLTPSGVAYLSPAASAKTKFVEYYSRWLSRRVVFAAIHPATIATVHTGRQFLEREERTHNDGGCLWFPFEVEESSRDVPGCTDRLRRTLRATELEWRWMRMDTGHSASVFAVASR